MLVHPQSKSLVLHAPDPLAIRDLFPKHSKLLSAPEGNIALKHTIETTRYLRNLGFKDTPAPIRSYYDWPGKHHTFEHQEVMGDALTMHEKCFNLSEMGTGKTYAALWAADHLMRLGHVHRAVICAPLSTLELIWLQDIFDILMHRTAGIVHGSMDHRMDVLRTEFDFYIVNHDGIKLTKVAQEIRRRSDINLFVLDEASDFRNAKSRRYKFLAWILEKKRRFWAITGTPTPNDPTDAWALARLVNPKGVPPSFGQFKRETMTQVSQFKWAAKKGAEDIVYRAMRPAVRFKKKDCLDLPPVVTIPVKCKLSKEQRDAFDAMQNDMVIQMKQGEITAVNAADQIGKLRQILLGAMRDPNTGQYIVLDHTDRLSELRRCIDGASAKVLVVVPYKGIIRVLEQELSPHYDVAVLNGDVTKPQRIAIIQAFKTSKKPHLMLCHPRIMSHGLNLVEADTTILYGPIYSNDQYQQVIERNNRTGQVNNMTVARIGGHPLEWEIYRMLDNKGITQDSILSLYRQVTGE
jgi:SNF2 family DNA or RNA helicase